MLFARGGAELLCLLFLGSVVAGIISIWTGMKGLAKGKVPITHAKQATGGWAKAISVIYILGGISIFVMLIVVCTMLPD